MADFLEWLATPVPVGDEVGNQVRHDLDPSWGALRSLDRTSSRRHRAAPSPGVSGRDRVVHQRGESLRRGVGALGQLVFPNGALWIAWPKKSVGVVTDVTEHVVREVALPLGLVDNKVCAIDETWTGLRFVWRTERRASPVGRRAIDDSRFSQSTVQGTYCDTHRLKRRLSTRHLAAD